MANVFGNGFPDPALPYQGLIWGTHQGVAVPAQKLVLKVRPKAADTATAPTVPPAGKVTVVVSLRCGRQRVYSKERLIELRGVTALWIN